MEPSFKRFLGDRATWGSFGIRGAPCPMPCPISKPGRTPPNDHSGRYRPSVGSISNPHSRQTARSTSGAGSVRATGSPAPTSSPRPSKATSAGWPSSREGKRRAPALQRSKRSVAIVWVTTRRREVISCRSRCASPCSSRQRAVTGVAGRSSSDEAPKTAMPDSPKLSPAHPSKLTSCLAAARIAANCAGSSAWRRTSIGASSSRRVLVPKSQARAVFSSKLSTIMRTIL